MNEYSQTIVGEMEPINLTLDNVDWNFVTKPDKKRVKIFWWEFPNNRMAIQGFQIEGEPAKYKYLNHGEKTA